MSQQGTQDQVFESVSELFSVLSTPIRLKIISAVCNGEKNVSELLAEINTTQPNMSQHLGMLYRSGVPADFKLGDHGLTKLKVAARGGAVFASFDRDVESFEDHLGPEILQWYDRLFDGRKLKILIWREVMEADQVAPPAAAGQVLRVGER